MNRKRLFLAVLLLTGIGLAAIIVGSRRTPEPSFEGKPLNAWFKAYAVTTGQTIYTPPAPGHYFTTNQPTWLNSTNRHNFIVVSNRLRWLVITNPPVFVPTPTKPPADDPWNAIRAIGSNAAPFLSAQMRHGVWEKFYERNFTNLPALLQKKLPHPAQRWLFRMRAIEIANRLGPKAHDTAPALLKLLYETDPRTLSAVMPALRSVRAERVDVAELILRLGTEKRFREVFSVASEMGWKDREVARLFGKILAGPDKSFHRDAIRMLEAGGIRALPAADAIIGALNHPDSEVRYLAARSLEQIAKEIPPEERPELETKLRVAVADQSVIVSNVSRRVLARLHGAVIPSPYQP